MARKILLCSLAFSLMALINAATAADQSPAKKPPPVAHALSKNLDHGRYLIRISGCNDCHTPGYAQSGGKTPDAQWLTGDNVGFRGPWGTTYPANLRLTINGMSEEDWIKMAHTVEMRPPMPWFSLRHMKKADLLAMYRYIRHLGPAGQPAPGYVPPGQEPKTAFILFVPQSPVLKSARADDAK